MKKTFIKTIFRDFKKNFTRLIAIVAIVALGVGFLIGLLSSTPDLQDSMDKYYDEYDMYDVLLKSTIGFSSNDVTSLAEDIQEIEKIEGYASIDSMGTYATKEVSTRVICTEETTSLNQKKIILGRMPTSSIECVVQNLGIFLDKNPIGDKIEIGDEIYTIVGVCNSPVYYYRMQENTQIGNGILDVVLYTIGNNFPITDIAITFKGADKRHSFKKEYFSYIEPFEKRLTDLSFSYLDQRLNSLYEEAFKEARKVLEDNPSIPSSMIDQILESQKEDIKKTVDEQFSELKWYVLNRKSNLSYIAFNENSTKVDKVAIIFPFFFFFIAALIALTSITRLVYEDRGAIGTLKSLGFSNSRILNKYLIYAIFACLIGSAGGLLLGVYGIPMVVYYAYNSLFQLPTGVFRWHSWCVLLSSISMGVTIFIVMLAVCLKALSEKPNALLVPKAPRAGKRILLERVGIFWKKLKFKYKSSIRNVFRFKRNLVMMVIGIGGCTGLMLVGLGLKDSLSGSSELQYDKVLTYDFSLGIKQEVHLDYLTDSTTLYLYQEEGKVKENKEYEVSILYTDSMILDYMNLNVDELPQTGVIISSDLANKFHLKKNSKIEIEVNSKSKEFIVSSVFENYIGNYIITSKSNEAINTMLVKLGPKDKGSYDTIVQKIYETNEINSVVDLASSKELYMTLTNGTELVILLIIFCSGLLAIIVIYNLTNININERIKEIATLKVLGYQKIEVLGYIYREIIMMSVFGILFGFGLGPLLNIFIMRQISSPGQCFPSTISGINFLYAFLITAIFVGIVLLFFIPKMRKIKMVESLKSVE